MISHVYFDFFGTLVDYDASIHPAVYNAPHQYARRAGLQLTEHATDEAWQRAWTELDTLADAYGVECSMHEIATTYSQLVGVADPLQHNIDRLVDEYLEAWTTDIVLAAAALETLTDLARDHYIAVVSNTHHEPLVPALIRRFGIEDLIADVITSVKVKHRKPDPRIFEYVLERHAITAKEAVFVGDNWRADVEGPRAVGMTAFYVGERAPGRTPCTLAELPALIRGITEGS